MAATSATHSLFIEIICQELMDEGRQARRNSILYLRE
jgi:hypothetical protein